MASQSLAVKYRPKSFSDVCEQESVIKIFENMIEEGTFPNSMLMCGPAGCGKTTSARIMANLINKGKGTPIEIDAASNSGVDNVRKIIDDSKFKALDAEYKVYILDEAHMVTAAAWASLLKLLEEPPAKTIYIFCTTDPQKIPNTILSRVQRFDFHRITYETIVERLTYIITCEQKLNSNITWELESLQLIAKIVDGGMRDAITLMDKCLRYSDNLSIENVVKTLGVEDYKVFFELTRNILGHHIGKSIKLVEDVYLQGRDLKMFVKQYVLFLLDVCKYRILKNFTYVQIPSTYESDLLSFTGDEVRLINKLLSEISKLQVAIKWESSPKVTIEATLFELCLEEK